MRVTLIVHAVTRLHVCETRNWIAAAVVVDGVPSTMIDYIPLYASPIGTGFAYWDFD